MRRVSAISGFPEYLPQEQRLFDTWKELISAHFSAHGFFAQENPVVESLDILLNKGDNHEIYVVSRLHGDEEEARWGLRYDLTIPLARYVVQHHHQLTFPYRRYQIAPVWRGERPQKGRYRQFYQCDIDVIGKDTLSHTYDAEVAAIMALLLEKLQMGTFTFFLNHKDILLEWIKQSGITEIQDALRWIDKKNKVGSETVWQALRGLGASERSLEILTILACDDPWQKKIHNTRTLSQDVVWQSACDSLCTVAEGMVERGVSGKCITIDFLLARGLTYYSGILYEATLHDYPALGSVCAGGRYAQLATSIDPSLSLPGVGISLGLSRVFAAFLEHHVHTMRDLSRILFTGNNSTHTRFLRLATVLRAVGMNVEIYGEYAHSLGKQIKYADQKHYGWVIMDNFDTPETVYIKNMDTGEQTTVKDAELAHFFTVKKKA